MRNNIFLNWIKSNIILTVAAVIVFLAGISLAIPQVKYAIFGEPQIKVIIDNQKCSFKTPPIEINGEVFLPVRDTFEALDCEISWDEATDEVIIDYLGRKLSIKTGRDTAAINNRRECSLSKPVAEIDHTTFIPFDFLETAIGASVEIAPKNKKVFITSPSVRDTLKDFKVTDDYRLSGEAAKYNGVTVIGDTGMEILGVSKEQALQYSDAINAIAESLPENVNCYSVLVPNMAEFYAPKDLYPNYVKYMHTVYANLDLRITPINTIKPLMEHADEQLFFKTDHHWTQRGAYYAYKEFITNAGGNIDPIDSFENNPSYGYRGSLVNFTKGTAGASLLGSDTLERFIPKAEVKGSAYFDGKLKEKFRDLKVVDTELTTYAAFIEGDVPIAHFKTNNESGRKLAIIKESYGNAFATWAVNNYSDIYVIDLREFNYEGSNNTLKISDFYETTHFDDLVIINYPVSVASVKHRQALNAFADNPISIMN